MATTSSAPVSTRPWTTPGLTPDTPARPDFDQAPPSRQCSSTRRRAGVSRSGWWPVKRTPGTGASGSSAPGARSTMRSTMPRAVSV